MNTSFALTLGSSAETFERLEIITRQLHESLIELGLEQDLIQVVRDIPDARDRLSHVGQMTEKAAEKVLNLIEISKPQCHNFKFKSNCFAQVIGHMSNMPHPKADDIGSLLSACSEFAEQSSLFAENQNSVLGEIMMTQDFQDLSGQVIKKVIEIISLIESQLLGLLVCSPPEHLSNIRPNTELAGPQAPDKALNQNDVDDLLASLGF